MAVKRQQFSILRRIAVKLLSASLLWNTSEPELLIEQLIDLLTMLGWKGTWRFMCLLLSISISVKYTGKSFVGNAIWKIICSFILAWRIYVITSKNMVAISLGDISHQVCKKTHSELHKDVRQHRCNIPIDSGLQGFDCDVCGRVFRRNHVMRWHMKIQTDVK